MSTLLSRSSARTARDGRQIHLKSQPTSQLLACSYRLPWAGLYYYAMPTLLNYNVQKKNKQTNFISKNKTVIRKGRSDIAKLNCRNTAVTASPLGCSVLSFLLKRKKIVIHRPCLDTLTLLDISVSFYSLLPRL